MTISIDSGLSDVGTTADTVVAQRYDYDAVYSKIREGKDHVILTNINAPFNRPHEVKIGVQGISDIYRNTDINPVNQAASSKGVKVLVATKAIAEKVDDTAPGMEVHLPYGTTLTFTVPKDDDIDVVQTVLDSLAYTLGVLLDEGTGNRIAEMVRGKMTPPTL